MKHHQISGFSLANILSASLQDNQIKSLRPLYTRLHNDFRSPMDFSIEVAVQPVETSIRVAPELADRMVGWTLRAQEITAVLNGAALFEGEMEKLLNTLEDLGVLREQGKNTGDLFLVPPGGRDASLVQALEYLVRESGTKFAEGVKVPYPWRVEAMPKDDDGNIRPLAIQDVVEFVEATRTLGKSINMLMPANVQVQVLAAATPERERPKALRTAELKGVAAGQVYKLRLQVRNGHLTVMRSIPEIRACDMDGRRVNWDAGEVHQAMADPVRIKSPRGDFFLPKETPYVGSLPPLTGAEDKHLKYFLSRMSREVPEETPWFRQMAGWLAGRHAASQAILATMASVPDALREKFDLAYAKLSSDEELGDKEIKLLRAYPARHLLLSVLTTTQVEADALLASKSLAEQMQEGELEASSEEAVQAVEPEPVNTLALAEETEEDSEVYASDPEPVTTPAVPEADPSEETTEKVETPQEAPAEAVA